MSGLDVQLLTITGIKNINSNFKKDFEDKTVEYDKRKVIVISARVHPGEPNGSWMCHGLI